MSDETTVDTSSEQPSGGLGTVSVKSTAAKGPFAGIVPTGATLLDTESSKGILANMQRMIDEKEAQKNDFLERMKDAVAWTAGGTQGPSQTLSLREKDRETQAADIYNMRQAMAQFQAQQRQSANLAKSLQSAVGGTGAGGALIDPAVAAEINRLLGIGNVGAAEKLYNDYVKEGIKFRNNPASYKRDIEIRVMGPDGKWHIEPVDAITAQRMVMGGGAQYATPEAKVAAEERIGTSPTSTKPQGAYTPSGERVKVAADANNPGGITVGRDENKNPIYASYVTPQEGTAATQKLLGDYISGQGPMQGVKVTPSSIVGMWVRGKPGEGAQVSGGNYLNTVLNELKAAGIEAGANDPIPNTPEANAALSRAVIKFEAGKNADKFLPHVSTDFKAGATPVVQTKPVQQAPVQQTPVQQAPAQYKTVPEIKQEMEVSKESEIARKKYFSEKVDIPAAQAVLDAGDSSADRISKNQRVLDIVNDPNMQKMFGQLAKGDIGTNIAKVFAEGIQAGKLGSFKLAGLQSAMQQLGASKEQIDNLKTVENLLNSNQVEYAKTAFKGQGSVSDRERELIAKTVGDITEPAKVISTMVGIMKERALFDQAMAREFKNHMAKTGDPSASFYAFVTTNPEAKRMIEEHNVRLAQVLNIDKSKLSNPYKLGVTPEGEGKTKRPISEFYRK